MKSLLLTGLILLIAAASFGCGDDGKTIYITVESEPTTQKAEPTIKAQPTAKPAVAQPTKVVQVQPTKAPAAPSKPQTVNGLEHRGAGSFSINEAVIGYEITIGGLKYRQCYFAKAPGNGIVSDGVVNPWPGEVIYSACGQGVQDPDTVNGLARRGAGSFAAGEAVVGYEITIGGLKYRLCYIASAPGSGSVSDGTINPWKNELAYPPCGQGVQDPDTVNGKFRRGGSGSFSAGEAVTGFFVLNGRKYENCYLAYAPAGGTITDGAANPWKKEVADDSVCN